MNAPIPTWVGGRLEPVPEIEVHRRGLPHRAVAVVVTRGARILIRQRSPAAYLAPSLWSSTCHAHLVWGETPEACAERLTRAEAPAAAGALRWRGMAEYRAPLSDGFVEHECVEVFLMRDLSPVLREGAGPAGGAPKVPGKDRTEGSTIGPVDTLPGGPGKARRMRSGSMSTTCWRRPAVAPSASPPWLAVALSKHLPLILG